MHEYKLFVWYNVLGSYWPGIAFAAARNKEEALEAIKQTVLNRAKDESERPYREWQWKYYNEELKKVEPVIMEFPAGDCLSGGD